MLIKVFSALTICVFFSSSLLAETYVREYTYKASEADSKLSSRTIALDQVKVLLLQEIGTHIRQQINITKDDRGNLFASEDVEAITAGLTKVEIIEEKWNGEIYYLKAKIEADTEQIVVVLEQIKKDKSNESLLRLEKLKVNQRKLNLAREEVIQLRNKLSQYMSDTDKEKIVDEYIRQVDQISLYDMYESGYNYYKRGQFKDAVYWYLKAAQQGNAEAQNNLGNMYFAGQGVKQDVEEALKWYIKSANQGNLNASNNLGNVYKKKNTKRLLNLSIYWYRKAANSGHVDAQFNLGYMYEVGKGVDADNLKAASWYEKAAAQGHPIAQNNLGYMYYKGYGVDQDYTKAIFWYKKSAGLGNKFAQLQLGDMYNEGKGVNQNYAEAAKWYKKAAKKGSPVAQNNLGFMYYVGQGVKTDHTKAIYWYRKAAEQGNMDAHYNLGHMYYKGYGVKQDKVKANEWYEKACEGGYKVACTAI